MTLASPPLKSYPIGMPPTRDAHDDHGTTLIQSVQRAMHLVETLASLGGSARAKELAFASGIPLPTTYHLLRTLAHEGYLAKLDDGSYVMSAAWNHLSSQHPVAQTLSHVRSTLRFIRDELHSAVYFAALQDGEISLLEFVSSPKSELVDLWVGIQDAAHATALGKAILASLNEDDRLDYLARHPLVDLTQHTITDHRMLERELHQNSRVSRDDEEYSQGVHCVGIPVLAGDMVGAIAILKRTDEHDIEFSERTVEVLSRGAHRIARAAAFSRIA